MASLVSARGAELIRRKPDFSEVLQDTWDPESNPEGIVNLAVAENSLMHAEMAQFINSHIRIDQRILSSSSGISGSLALKKAFCHFLNKYFCPYTPLIPSHVAVTSGVTNAIERCAWSLCDPGDYVLVGRPFWSTFRTMFGVRANVHLLEVSLQGIDPFRIEALQRYENTYIEAMKAGKRIRAILLCSPSNPLGICLSRQVLTNYMRLSNKLDVHLICDEIYALSVWQNPEIPLAPGFTSALCVNAREFMNPSMLHVTWGISKDFGLTGLRIGCLISQENKQFQMATENISLFDPPSCLADGVVGSLLTDDSFIRDLVSLNRSRLADNYSYVTEFFRAHKIPYRESNAALFVWMNLRAAIRNGDTTDGEILMRLRQEKLFIASAAECSSEIPGWFRVVFAQPKEVLNEGLKRLIKVITDINITSEEANAR